MWGVGYRVYRVCVVWGVCVCVCVECEVWGIGCIECVCVGGYGKILEVIILPETCWEWKLMKS